MSEIVNQLHAEHSDDYDTETVLENGQYYLVCCDCGKRLQRLGHVAEAA